MTKLKAWREQNRVSLEDVQDLTGVSVASISRAENARYEISTKLKIKIAKGLGVRIRDLFEVPEPKDFEEAA